MNNLFDHLDTDEDFVLESLEKETAREQKTLLEGPPEKRVLIIPRQTWVKTGNNTGF